MKTDSFFSKKQRLDKIKQKILYLQAIQAIIDEGYKKSILMIAKYPLSFKKIKLIMALLLPKFILKKIQKY